MNLGSGVLPEPSELFDPAPSRRIDVGQLVTGGPLSRRRTGSDGFYASPERARGIFAMALAFIWGQAGILSFGQAIFFGIGGYSMGLVSLDRLPLLGDSAIVGFILALVVPAIVAYILGRLLFLGRGLSGAYFAIVTLCAAVVAQTLAEQWNYLGGSTVSSASRPLPLRGMARPIAT